MRFFFNDLQEIAKAIYLKFMYLAAGAIFRLDFKIFQYLQTSIRASKSESLYYVL